MKGLRQSKVIDLETLDKINEYHFGPLRVRKAIKSKLDDISGINNVPLFGEDFNPEVFRDHATMDSLRNIWRPRLKNSQSTDNDKQSNELLHIIKEVSARTTKTSGAAAEILSKVAGSLSWGSNSPVEKSSPLVRQYHNASISNSVQSQSPSQYAISPTINNYESNSISSPYGSATDNANTGRTFKDITRRSTQITNQDVDDLGIEIIPSKSTLESITNLSDVRKQSSNINSLGIDDDLPSIVKSEQNSLIINGHDHVQVSPMSTPEPVKDKIASASPITTPTTSLPQPSQTSQPLPPIIQQPQQKEEDMKIESLGLSDFVKYNPKVEIKPKHIRAISMDETSLMTYRHLGEIPNRSRPNSFMTWKNDASSIAGVKSWYEVDYDGEDFEFDESHGKIFNDNNNDNDDDDDDEEEEEEENEGNKGMDIQNVDQQSPFSESNRNMELIYNRPRSIAGISTYQQAKPPIHLSLEKQKIGTEKRLEDILLTSHVDTETYLLYEQLRKQHSTLENKYKQLQSLAKQYEDMAKQLRNTYARRSAEFGQIERQFKLIVDEQMEMEKQLKHVEDDSAKLHYELNVLNENLVEREENVAGFYSKLEILERKMKDDQQSLTTMFIMGNFFKYYWQKITDFLGRPRS
ncbi:unnamed protein product [Cunninghamella echinulata]